MNTSVPFSNESCVSNNNNIQQAAPQRNQSNSSISISTDSLNSFLLSPSNEHERLHCSMPMLLSPSSETNPMMMVDGDANVGASFPRRRRRTIVLSELKRALSSSSLTPVLVEPAAPPLDYVVNVFEPTRCVGNHGILVSSSNTPPPPDVIKIPNHHDVDHLPVCVSDHSSSNFTAEVFSSSEEMTMPVQENNNNSKAVRFTQNQPQKTLSPCGGRRNRERAFTRRRMMAKQQPSTF